LQKHKDQSRLNELPSLVDKRRFRRSRLTHLLLL